MTGWDTGRMAELARPRQVTVACFVIMLGAVLVVLAAFDQIAALTSLDTRERIEDALAQPPADALGLGVPEVQRIMRVLAMVGAACATAMAVLGWHAMQQRSTSARLWLSVLAVPLFLTGIGTGGLMSSVVAAAAAMLWVQPARDWFDGIAPRPDARAAELARAEDASTRPGTPPAQSPGEPSPAEPSPGEPSPTGVTQPPPYAGQFGSPASAWVAPQGQPAPAPAAPAAPARRPGALVLAAVITWVCCLLATVLMVIGAVMLSADPDLMLDEMRRQNPDLVEDSGITTEAIRAMLWLMVAGVTAWSVAASAVAALALRRLGWARITLIVSAACAGGAMLLGVLSSPVMLFPLAACGATVVLLLRPEVAAWFAGARR